MGLGGRFRGQREGRVTTHSSLENALVAPVRLAGLAHLLLASLGIDDAILARNLLAIPPLIPGLLRPVLIQLLPKASLELADLGVLDIVPAGARRVRLEELNLVLDARVQHLGARDQRLERAGRGRVRRRQRPLVRGRDLRNVRCEGPDVGFGGFDAGEEVLVREHGRALGWHCRRDGLAVAVLLGGCGACVRAAVAAALGVGAVVAGLVRHGRWA